MSRTTQFRKSLPGRLVIGGWLLFPTVLVVLNVVSRFVDHRTPAGMVEFLIPTSVLALIVVALLYVTTAVLVPAMLGALLLLMTGGLIGAFGLVRISNFYEFSAGLTLFVAPLLVLSGSVMALRRRRRGALEPVRAGERRVLRIVAAAFVIVIAVSGGLTYQRRSSIDAPPGVPVLFMYGDTFEPATLSFKPGDRQIFVVNEDDYAHRVAVESWDVNVYVSALTSRLIDIEVPRETGSFKLSCPVTGHDDMIGTVKVTR